VPDAASILGPLRAETPARADLVDDVVAALSEDDRVRGLWLTGSLGAGDGDELSDVDMFVLVAEDQVVGFADSWPAVADRFHPLLSRRIGPAPMFTHVLPGWLRWDVVIGGPDRLVDLDRARVTALLDRDGSTAGSPPHLPPEPALVYEITEEFLRVLGLLPVVLGRGELVTAASGVGLLRQMLITLLRYRAEGSLMSGALNLNRVLLHDEVAALEALPAVYADRPAAIRSHLACAAMFLPVARELLGDEYPTELEAACWEHLHDRLGVSPPATAVRQAD
jgi:predicted nucleotidyltransferase